MPLTRINPPDVYPPFANVYSQVIESIGARFVHVAGTVSLDVNRNLIGDGDMGLQVKTTYENLGKSLAAVGATPDDVVRIHIFTLDVDRYLAEGTPEALAFFSNGVPTATLVGVVRLADPRYLVEIEATAVLP
jgi:enamine deaminase RidA (YjgF/YER057c/UK114 family)